MRHSIFGLIVFAVVTTSVRGDEWAFRPSDQDPQAIQRIERLGGRVRYFTAKKKYLEVDFQFASEQLGDEHLQYVTSLEHVVSLRLKRTKITDDGLAQIGKIKSLRRLFLEETAISDVGLEHIASLPNWSF